MIVDGESSAAGLAAELMAGAIDGLGAAAADLLLLAAVALNGACRRDALVLAVAVESEAE